MKNNESKIRVLHVYPQLNCGGVERVIENLIRFADRERFSFALLTQNPGEYEDEFRKMGIAIYRIPFGGDKKKYKKALAEFFRDNRFDVVHTHMHHQMMLVNKVAKKAGVKCRVAHSHINHQDWPWWKRLLRIPKFAFHNAAATDLIGCSEGALNWLFPVRMGGEVIPNGIDASRYAYTHEQRYTTRRALGISADKKVVLNVGRLSAQKNQKFLLDIAEEMKGKDDYLFFIVGGGPMSAELEEIVRRKNLKNVRLLGERHDIPALMSASDLFLLPSLYEGASSIVMREALANGLPIIFNLQLDSGADGDSPQIYPRDISRLAEWVTDIENICRRMPMNGMEPGLPCRFVEFKSDVEAMAARVAEVYLRRL